MADSVAAVDGEGRITAVETGFAKARGFPVASVRNASGIYTQPTEANVIRALRYARVRPNGTHQLVFTGPGADVYYPSSYSYVIAQTTGYDPAKGYVLASFIYYAATTGQGKANALGYAALSPNLVSAAVDAAEQIPGAPPRPAGVPRYNPDLDDGSGGGPPPVVPESPAAMLLPGTALVLFAAGVVARRRRGAAPPQPLTGEVRATRRPSLPQTVDLHSQFAHCGTGCAVHGDAAHSFRLGGEVSRPGRSEIWTDDGEQRPPTRR